MPRHHGIGQVLCAGNEPTIQRLAAAGPVLEDNDDLYEYFLCFPNGLPDEGAATRWKCHRETGHNTPPRREDWLLSLSGYATSARFSWALRFAELCFYESGSVEVRADPATYFLLDGGW